MYIIIIKVVTQVYCSLWVIINFEIGNLAVMDKLCSDDFAFDFSRSRHHGSNKWQGLYVLVSWFHNVKQSLRRLFVPFTAN